MATGKKKKRSKKIKSRKRKPSLFQRFAAWVRRVMFVTVASVLLVVVTLRYVDPPVNFYQLQEWARLGDLKSEWIPLERISRNAPLSAIAAEDVNFCKHHGFDFDAIRAALQDKTRFRGGSTISQQVAKNVFLWQGRSWVRKGFEAGFTGLIELLWGKRRIMEVYLNVAEFDEGVFGIGAASKHYFGVPASSLSSTQAARLMAILPSPKRRSASRPGAHTERRTSTILGGARAVGNDSRSACL